VPKKSSRTLAPYGRQVFVNCPYDEAYLPLLRVLVFAVHACGFRARLAVEEINSGKPRLQRITDLIRECKLGIHDLSRVQLSDSNDLPRFNMPFECGVFVGAQTFGNSRQHSKAFLLLEAETHRHLKTLSDAAGLDPRVHKNNPSTLIACTRDFLAGHITPRPLGAAHLISLYADFEMSYPTLAQRLGHEPSQLRQLETFPDWRWIMAEWLAERAAAK
jgi:hypothetical protein